MKDERDGQDLKGRQRDNVVQLVVNNQQPLSKDGKFTSFKNKSVEIEYPTNWGKRTIDEIVERETKYATLTMKKVIPTVGNMVKGLAVVFGEELTPEDMAELDEAMNELQDEVASEDNIRRSVSANLADTVVEFGPPKKEDIYASVKRTQGDIREIMNIYEMLGPMASVMIGSIGGMMGLDVSSQAKIKTVNDIKMLEITSTVELEKGKKFKSLVYLIPVDRKGYAVSFNAPSKVFDTYNKRYFKNMIESVKFN